MNTRNMLTGVVIGVFGFLALKSFFKKPCACDEKKDGAVSTQAPPDPEDTIKWTGKPMIKSSKV